MASRAKKGTGQRELIDTGTSKRYIRRDGRGRFTQDQVEVGKSLSADRRRSARTTAPRGQGDRGDRGPSR